MQIAEEPRSFAPRPGRRAVKVDPVPDSGATADQLGRGVNQLHACLEDEKEKSARHRRLIRRDVRLVAQILGGPTDEPNGDPAGDTVFARLKRVELAQRRTAIWWDRAKTAVWVAGPLLSAFGAILWWLEGNRLGRLLGLV